MPTSSCSNCSCSHYSSTSTSASPSSGDSNNVAVVRIDRRLVACAFFLALLFSTAEASGSSLSSQRSSDGGYGCDWSGSGFDLSDDAHLVIRPVRLRCSQGSVDWSYPRGALRVVLSPSARPGAPTNFRACIKIKPGAQAARIYVEERSASGGKDPTLRPLFMEGDGLHPDLPRCALSMPLEGEVVLYVEAETGAGGGVKGLGRRDAGFIYELTPISETSVDPDEECRPCDEEELLKAYCSSDFVIRGKILRVTDTEDLDRSEIVVDSIKTLRSSSTSSILPTTNPRNKREIHRVYAPLRCKVKSGPGEYLFAVRKKLGDPFLACAATIKQWAELMRAAKKDGRAPCVLEA